MLHDASIQLIAGYYTLKTMRRFKPYRPQTLAAPNPKPSFVVPEPV